MSTQAPGSGGTTRAVFRKGAVEDLQASEKEGRPIFKDVDFVRIFTPGDEDTIIDQPAWLDARHPMSHINRFPVEWAQYQAGNQTEFGSGTPLSEWAPMSRSQVEEMAYRGVRTVEDLAGMSDGILQRFGPYAQQMRQKAKDFLAAAKDNAHVGLMRSELEKRDALLKAQGEAMEAMNLKMAELMERVTAPNATAPAPQAVKATQAKK